MWYILGASILAYKLIDFAFRKGYALGHANGIYYMTRIIDEYFDTQEKKKI